MFLIRHMAVLAAGVLFFSVGVSAGETDSAESVSTELLANAGIATVWQEGLPLKTGERVDTINLLGDGVYVLTTTNYIFGLNAATGGYRFADRIAAYGLELLPLSRTGDTLNVMTGSSLRGFDATTGKETGRLTVPYGVVAVPARNETHSYLAADDGKVYAYDASDGVMAFKAAVDSGSLVTNVAAKNDCVVFTTNKGAIVAMAPDGPVQKWRYDAPGAIKGRVTLEGGDLYVSGMDTNVYRFNVATGKIVWNYMAGAQLENGPRVTSSTVYQYADNNGVYALDKKTGKVLWQAKDGRDLLAEHKGKAYLISKSQSLIIVDNVTGKRIGEVSMPGVDRYASNVAGEMMYIGSSATGRVACLKPMEE